MNAKIMFIIDSTGKVVGFPRDFSTSRASESRLRSISLSWPSGLPVVLPENDQKEPLISI